MGASASSTAEKSELKGVPAARNYVPISDPPQYDLKFCSTDSDITELEEERRQQLAGQLPPRSPSGHKKPQPQENIASGGSFGLRISSKENPNKISSKPSPTPVSIGSEPKSLSQKVSPSFVRSPLPSFLSSTGKVPSREGQKPAPTVIHKNIPITSLESEVRKPTSNPSQNPVPGSIRKSSPVSSFHAGGSKQVSRQGSIYRPSAPTRYSNGHRSFGKVLTPIPSVSIAPEPQPKVNGKQTPAPNVPNDPRYQESRQSFAKKISPSSNISEPRSFSDAPILEDDEYLEPSTLPDDIPEEQRTYEPEQTERTQSPEANDEEELIRVTKVVEEAEPEATLLDTNTPSVLSPPKLRDSFVVRPSVESPQLSKQSSKSSEEKNRVSSQDPVHPTRHSTRHSITPVKQDSDHPSLRSATIESLKSICTAPNLCKKHNCQRAVKFTNRHCCCDRYPRRRSSRVIHPTPYPYDNEDDDWDDGYDECGCTDADYDCTYDGFVEYASSKGCVCVDNDEANYVEGMPDYQRYSREQPEKDANHGKKAADGGNMRECCRPCYPNRTASLKHNNAHLGHAAANCRCAQTNSGSRHNSESYVAYRGGQKNPAYSKSTPNHLEERDSYQNFCDSHQPRRSSPRPAPPQRKPPSRVYPSFEHRHSGGQDRPHIPLPPPPQQFRADEPLRTSHQHQEQLHHRDSRTSRELSRDSVTLEDTTHDEEKDMYNRNTNRNYMSKKPYRSYPPLSKALKPYLYEESGGSCSTCSNNCSGYDHCPMHHSCRCQCRCMNGDDNYCSQDQSDDQLSYCSESSNSECMNLAYQRTGDYPELMDELENTLSHRNRLRVQKTMQRFEMLSRQNKNLEKPIFEDDESVRHYNMHRDNRECRCQHCENKYRRSYTRSETLAKRPNYKPTPFPRNSGYVEKVARYMDPNLNHRRDNNQRKKMDNGHDTPTTVTNSTGTWQKDIRNNEWVKVDPDHQNGQNQYDFENSYPPLPPRPLSEHMYDRRNYCRDRSCTCAKCMRRR